MTIEEAREIGDICLRFERQLSAYLDRRGLKHAGVSIIVFEELAGEWNHVYGATAVDQEAARRISGIVGRGLEEALVHELMMGGRTYEEALRFIRANTIRP